MDIEGRTVLILGGSGLVGRAIARRLVRLRPSRLVIGALHEVEAGSAVRELASLPGSDGIEFAGEWGDVFLRETHRGRSRVDLLASDEGRAEVLEDLFGDLDEEAFGRSALVALLERHRPEILIDCVNTATAIAYQDIFTSVERLRRANLAGGAEPADIEAHLATLYLPQLIRHVQLLLEGMRRAGTRSYVKIGTSGTGGMGLNVPFTHSEERPSRTLLAKASVAGAHSLLLFLMGRTPDGPAVKEVKPAAAISWKRIGFGPVVRGGRPIPRYDAIRPLPLDEAFADRADGTDGAWERRHGALESVFLDAGENGQFSVSEFEAVSSLGLMEVVTPEEIAEVVVAEIVGRPTGRDIVGALDASVFGPTYRGGVLREAALRHMEELEARHGVRSVAFEMLGPPRLSKLLFEAHLLERLFPDLAGATRLEPEETAARAERLIESEERLRSDIVSIGLPILLADGKRLLRGPIVGVTPAARASPVDERLASRGWVDLRPANWVRWKERCRSYTTRVVEAPGGECGSRTDLDVRARSGAIRPGALAAFVLRTEDEGERIKR
ncbi:MAG: short-chain dehydrogenase [Gemmatimonadota bacterium]